MALKVDSFLTLISDKIYDFVMDPKALQNLRIDVLAYLEASKI